MPKKKLPSTLKLTFQEKAPPYSYQGKQVRYIDAVQFLIERFFSKPLLKRLEELGGRVEKMDTDLAQRLRSIKTEIEQQELDKYVIEKRRKIKIIFQDSDMLALLIDQAVERHFIHAIDGMLNYLMVEAMLIETALPFNEATRQVVGLYEKPARKKAILTSLRACLRDKALDGRIGVRQGGVRNQKHDWTPEKKLVLARNAELLHDLWQWIVEFIESKHIDYDPNAPEMLKRHAKFDLLVKGLHVPDRLTDKAFGAEFNNLIKEVYKRKNYKERGAKKPRHLMPSGLALQHAAYIIDPQANIPFETLRAYCTEGRKASSLAK